MGVNEENDAAAKERRGALEVAGASTEVYGALTREEDDLERLGSVMQDTADSLS